MFNSASSLLSVALSCGLITLCLALIDFKSSLILLNTPLPSSPLLAAVRLFLTASVKVNRSPSFGFFLAIAPTASSKFLVATSNASCAPFCTPSSRGLSLFTGFNFIIAPISFASNFNPNFLAAYNNPPVKSPASLKIARLVSNNSSLDIFTSLPAKGPESYLNLFSVLSNFLAG